LISPFVQAWPDTGPFTSVAIAVPSAQDWVEVPRMAEQGCKISKMYAADAFFGDDR